MTDIRLPDKLTVDVMKRELTNMAEIWEFKATHLMEWERPRDARDAILWARVCREAASQQ